MVRRVIVCCALFVSASSWAAEPLPGKKQFDAMDEAALIDMLTSDERDDARVRAAWRIKAHGGPSYYPWLAITCRGDGRTCVEAMGIFEANPEDASSSLCAILLDPVVPSRFRQRAYAILHKSDPTLADTAWRELWASADPVPWDLVMTRFETIRRTEPEEALALLYEGMTRQPRPHEDHALARRSAKRLAGRKRLVDPIAAAPSGTFGEAYDDRWDRVRKASRRGATPQDALPALVAAAYDVDVTVRVASVKALRKRLDPALLPLLHERLVTEPVASLRHEYIAMTGVLGHASSVQILLDELEKTPGGPRMMAITQAMALHGDPSFRAALEAWGEPDRGPEARAMHKALKALDETPRAPKRYRTLASSAGDGVASEVAVVVARHVQLDAGPKLATEPAAEGVEGVDGAHVDELAVVTGEDALASPLPPVGPSLGITRPGEGEDPRVSRDAWRALPSILDLNVVHVDKRLYRATRTTRGHGVAAGSSMLGLGIGLTAGGAAIVGSLSRAPVLNIFGYMLGVPVTIGGIAVTIASAPMFALAGKQNTEDAYRKRAFKVTSVGLLPTPDGATLTVGGRF